MNMACCHFRHVIHRNGRERLSSIAAKKLEKTKDDETVKE